MIAPATLSRCPCPRCTGAAPPRADRPGWGGAALITAGIVAAIALAGLLA